MIEIPSYTFPYRSEVSHEVVTVFGVVMWMDAKWREAFQSEALSSFLLMSLKF